MASATRGIVILGGLYLIFWVFKRTWMDKYRVPIVGNAKAKPALLTLSTSISAGFFGILVLVMPWHPMALFVFVVLSFAYNGIIHLGYDFFPVSWRQHSVLKYLNATTHHIYHHQKSDCNCSFIFTFWDNWMSWERLPETVEAREK